MTDYLQKKMRGEPLSAADYQAFVQGVVDRSLSDDYSIRMLHAIYDHGMNAQETYALTDALIHTGSPVNLNDLRPIADKHSTGGVGDSTSLVVLPAAVACGLRFAKLSGRSLGHTGGTIDKLECIPGFQVRRTPQQMHDQIRDIGLCIAGATEDIAPGDRVLYALRDASGTVASIPLIASSILSKKMSVTSDVLVLDVKFGKGAFMPTLEQAIELGELMCTIARKYGRRTRAVISRMDAPLCDRIGNAAELLEVVEILHGMHVDTPLYTLCIEICAHLLDLAGGYPVPQLARQAAEDAIASGEAMGVLRQMVAAQGGDLSALELSTLRARCQCAHKAVVTAKADGYITGLNPVSIGNAARALGKERATLADPPDATANIEIHRNVGSPVAAGDPVLTLHSDHAQRIPTALQLLQDAVEIGAQPPARRPLVVDVLTK